MICIWSSWCHCHPIISCCSKIQNVLPFCCRPTQVVLKKRPLNRCNSSSKSYDTEMAFELDIHSVDKRKVFWCPYYSTNHVSGISCRCFMNVVHEVFWYSIWFWQTQTLHLWLFPFSLCFSHLHKLSSSCSSSYIVNHNLAESMNFTFTNILMFIENSELDWNTLH